MSTAIQKANGGEVLPAELSQKSLEVLRNSVCPAHTDTEIEFFIQYCRVRGVDPFAQMIHSVVRTSQKTGERRQTFQTGIECMRAQAETTGKYRGQKEPLWCGQDGQWTDVWLSKEPPAAAKVGVLRADFDEPTYETALWSEYKPAEDWMWRKMPSVMLAKCAEAKALRKAFPQTLHGLYSDDEMAQAAPAVKEYHGREYREDKPPSQGGCVMCDAPATVQDDVGIYCVKHAPKDSGSHKATDQSPTTEPKGAAPAESREVQAAPPSNSARKSPQAAEGASDPKAGPTPNNAAQGQPVASTEVFGWGKKHRDTPMSEVPPAYLNWCLEKASAMPSGLRGRIAAELERREESQEVPEKEPPPSKTTDAEEVMIAFGMDRDDLRTFLVANLGGQPWPEHEAAAFLRLCLIVQQQDLGALIDLRKQKGMSAKDLWTVLQSDSIAKPLVSTGQWAQAKPRTLAIIQKLMGQAVPF